MLEEVYIDKLVHGGQGLGTLKSGQKIFVWNALPGETVGVRVGRKKRDYAEGFAEKIIKPSEDRIEPLDEAYLSTSPWQILTLEAENNHKKQILTDVYKREKITLPEFEVITKGQTTCYRNKMEYSFWGDEEGIHLALFHRASHGKRIIEGSSIARPEIDDVAQKIVAVLNKNGIRGTQLKTVILRVNKKGDVVAALFVKDKSFPRIQELEKLCAGIVVNFSNPKSPASIFTKQLYAYGDTSLQDDILGKSISYDVHSFFQVNLPIFEEALADIKKAVKGRKQIIDMYAGVGTIGLSVGATKLVELDKHNIFFAKKNTDNVKIEVIEASSERALELIAIDTTVIFDPPRAGLHAKIVDKLLDVLPEKIVYLSCNPATQARDIARLNKSYKLSEFKGYNFFPRTPHIETLAILEKGV